jgi:formate--tetrahydrofolate ligase
MKNDIQIASETPLLPISRVAEGSGILREELEFHGEHKAKVSLGLLNRLKERRGKLILVTAITPTSMGEGKTTVSIGLSMALNRIGHSSIVTLREPSLGPVFGIKGGAAGGGHAQVLPMEDINLHFTGDFHAVTSAHNLLSAMLDNHIHQGNKLDVDPARVVYRRAIDMNDRSLRTIEVGVKGVRGGLPRRDGFIISAASEVMAILALSRDYADLKTRLGNILVAYTRDERPIHACDLQANGAMAALLRDALKPNLVQTTENTPAFVHCGPFANIAHGTNSILATEMALRLADFVVTESGFASDLGAEKFLDIVARVADFKVDMALIVATIRALKLHGGAEPREVRANGGTQDHLEDGIRNLDKHVENMRKFGVPVVVALNRFETDSDPEIDVLRKHCSETGIPMEVSDAHRLGGTGALGLAGLVRDVVHSTPSRSHPLYELSDTIEGKIGTIAREIYGATGVTYDPRAREDLERVRRLGLESLPVCIAKTPRSLSDRPDAYGVPSDFQLNIGSVETRAGAGFLVPISGNILLMPGLPKEPAALKVDLDSSGTINGLF